MKCPRAFIVTAFVVVAACAPARPIRYYRIEIPAPLAATANTDFGVALQVASIDSPPIMRDGRILYQVGTHEVGAYEYHRWVETPDRVVQDSLVRMLRSSGKYQSVDTPRSTVKPDYIVQGKIYEFSEMDKPAVFSRVSLRRQAERCGHAFIPTNRPSAAKRFPTSFTPSMKICRRASRRSSPASNSTLPLERRPGLKYRKNCHVKTDPC